MRVEVYYNLHKHCFSVRALEGPNKGRVIKHANTVELSQVTFAVQPAGRARVLREKRKNVHAVVRGDLLDGSVGHSLDRMTEVCYNPYLYETFVAKKSGKAVKTASYVYMCGRTVHADDVNCTH